MSLIGLEPTPSKPSDSHSHSNGSNGSSGPNEVSNGHDSKHKQKQNGNAQVAVQPKHSESALFSQRTRGLLKAYLQCSLLITAAAPFGFAALSHISYPTMVLGKSCKLVPVMIMNVILYRRKFALHKYFVVAMVTAGITMFMAFSHEGHSSKHKAGDSELNKNGLLGITYLLINLILDGTINSTQDELFAKYKVTGQQMMFFINLTSTLVTTFLSLLPLPNIPVIHPSDIPQSELKTAVNFITQHPSIKFPLAQFALTGSLGQLFIYETLQHFGSLTLVYVRFLFFCYRQHANPIINLLPSEL
jgi:UDP-galactose transporter B1